MAEHQKSDLNTHIVYSAELAQGKADYEKTAKGIDLKLGKDKKIIEAITALITKNFSPDAVIMYFKNEGWSTDINISTKTLHKLHIFGII